MFLKVFLLLVNIVKHQLNLIVKNYIFLGKNVLYTMCIVINISVNNITVQKKTCKI